MPSRKNDGLQSWYDLTGLSRTIVEEITKTHDAAEVVETRGLFLQFFKKRVAKANPPVTVLIAVGQIAGRPNEVEFVVKVYDDFADDLAGMTPLELLEAFVSRFGTDIRVGPTIKRMFLRESVTLRGQDINNPFAVLHADQHVLSVMLLAGHLQEMRMDCALCFAVRAGEYRTYLDARGQSYGH